VNDSETHKISHFLSFELTVIPSGAKGIMKVCDCAEKAPVASRNQ